VSKLGAVGFLKSNPLFGSLSDEALNEVVGVGYTRPVKRGEVLFLQGDPGDRLYLVLSGEVRISAGGPEGQQLHLNTLGPGDVNGEIALMDGGERTASATVTQDGMMFCIDRPEFLKLLEREPGITMQLLQLLCSRVRWTSTLLEDTAFLSHEARLAKRLLAIAAATGRAVEGGREIRLSQSDLATYLNLSRQFVNQILQGLQREEIVSLGHGRVVIRKPDELLKRTAS